MSHPAIVAERLTKRFGPLGAVREITFRVSRGECVGLLGPNGAGKTTTLRMITCASPPTEGSLMVLGLSVTRDAAAIKARLGVVPQEHNLHRELTAFENLYCFARYFALPSREARRRAEELLRLASLWERRDDLTDILSGGMKRRLLISRALINRPVLLVLDEPTVGLDPQSRHHIWKTIRDLQREGLTILLTTHAMEEAAHLCDRVIVIHEGGLLADGAPLALITTHLGGDCVEAEVPAASFPAFQERLNGFALAHTASMDGRHYLYLKDGQPLLTALSTLPHHHLVHRPATLEDVFLKLTGRGLS